MGNRLPSHEESEARVSSASGVQMKWANSLWRARARRSIAKIMPGRSTYRTGLIIHYPVMLALCINARRWFFVSDSVTGRHHTQKVGVKAGVARHLRVKSGS